MELARIKIKEIWRMIMVLKRSVRLLSIFLPMSFALSSTAYAVNSNLQSLSDTEMSDVNGQALMSLSYLAPTDSANPMKSISNNTVGFYKLGLEAEMELNANIKNLQLGCGGSNGPDACDLDIKNLSLSGLPDSYDKDGVPVYNNGRASTSGKITNPFMEFAIANPNSASTREVKGIRFSAEKISALLTAGLENLATAPTDDGIQRLSGFMQIAPTTGTATTKQTTFGKSPTQQIGGYAHLCAGLIGLACSVYNRDIHFTSDTSNSKSTGITVPSVSTGFDLPGFVVNGKRQQNATINDIRTNLATIPIASDGTSNYPASLFQNDQLRVNLDCNGVSGGSGIIGCNALSFLKDQATFKMGAGSKINNLNLKIDFEQALSMIHNIPLSGTGGYLSLQTMALLWPGAKVAGSDVGQTNISAMSGNTDVAQPGWWMSFNEPVQLGKLNVTQPVVLDDATLAQVAGRVTQALNPNNPNKPQADASNLIKLAQLLADQPLTSTVVADLGDYTRNNPVYLKLQNQQLSNQAVKSNCYGTLKFC